MICICLRARDLSRVLSRWSTAPSLRVPKDRTVECKAWNRNVRPRSPFVVGVLQMPPYHLRRSANRPFHHYILPVWRHESYWPCPKYPANNILTFIKTTLLYLVLITYYLLTVYIIGIKLAHLGFDLGPCGFSGPGTGWGLLLSGSCLGLGALWTWSCLHSSQKLRIFKTMVEDTFWLTLTRLSWLGS